MTKTYRESAWNKEGMVVTADPKNCTYLVSSPAGVLCQKGKHLQKFPLPCQVIDGSYSSIRFTGCWRFKGHRFKGHHGLAMFKSSFHTYYDYLKSNNTQAARGCIAQGPSHFREEEEIHMRCCQKLCGVSTLCVAHELVQFPSSL